MKTKGDITFTVKIDLDDFNDVAACEGILTLLEIRLDRGHEDEVRNALAAIPQEARHGLRYAADMWLDPYYNSTRLDSAKRILAILEETILSETL